MSSYQLERDLPFYPTYESEIQGYVTIWWFAKNFSQSRYNYKKIASGSNACTIITILLAARCYYDNIKIKSNYDYELNPSIVCAFAESVLEGNDIHEKLRRSGVLENINLTVPEAIESAGKKLRYITEWKSVLYMTDLRDTLFKHLRDHVTEWYSTTLFDIHPDLYVILITDHRSILFVFQDEPDTISLIDSHQHLNHGAIIAQVPRVRLKSLCQWFHCMISECFNSQPDCYELSFLYFKKEKTMKRKFIE